MPKLVAMNLRPLKYIIFPSSKEANRLLNYHEHSTKLSADPEVGGITGNVQDETGETL
jgi:hypothetical protein